MFNSASVQYVSRAAHSKCGHCSTALEMRQYLTDCVDCVLMPHLPVSFLRNESNNDGRARAKKVKDAYTYFEVSHRHSFMIVALFTGLNQYRLSESMPLQKNLLANGKCRFILSKETNCLWCHFGREFLLQNIKMPSFINLSF